MGLYIFRGLGWLVFPIFIIGWGIAKYLLVVNGGAEFYRASVWPEAIAVVSGCLLVAVIGIYFNLYVRPMIHDLETGDLVRSPSHTLLFIPFQYWGIIILVVKFRKHYDELNKLVLSLFG